MQFRRGGPLMTFVSCLIGLAGIAMLGKAFLGGL
jgi:hypothetical protein